MKYAPLLILLLALDACGVEQSQPVPMPPNDRWGHLAPDPQRQQQAEQPGAPAARG